MLVDDLVDCDHTIEPLDPDHVRGAIAEVDQALLELWLHRRELLAELRTACLASGAPVYQQDDALLLVERLTARLGRLGPELARLLMVDQIRT